MGIAYKICDCRNGDTRKEENNDLSYNSEINQHLFLKNKNNLTDVNIKKKNNPSEDTIEFNRQVKTLAKNYQNSIPKKTLNEHFKYDFILKKNITPKIKNNILMTDKEIETKELYKSCMSEGGELKKLKSLLSQKFKYTGEKSNKNFKEGFGICKWNNDTKYIGNFNKNKAEGYGIYIEGKNKYKGEFHNDSANGFGVSAKGNVFYYIGYWLDDMQDGYGYETWKDKSEYQGEFKFGKKHGIGVYAWDDGSKYEGYWNQNVREGYGIMYYSKATIYIGEWKNNLKDGFGELLFKDKKYIGFFANDKIEGFGFSYLNKVNKAFMGFWKNGKQLGFGKLMTRNKKKYGLWSEDSQVNWFKSEEEAFEYLEYEGYKNYKNFFLFTLDDIRNYCINNDEFNNLLK